MGYLKVLDFNLYLTYYASWKRAFIVYIATVLSLASIVSLLILGGRIVLLGVEMLPKYGFASLVVISFITVGEYAIFKFIGRDLKKTYDRLVNVPTYELVVILDGIKLVSQEFANDTQFKPVISAALEEFSKIPNIKVHIQEKENK